MWRASEGPWEDDSLHSYGCERSPAARLTFRDLLIHSATIYLTPNVCSAPGQAREPLARSQCTRTLGMDVPCAQLDSRNVPSLQSEDCLTYNNDVLRVIHVYSTYSK
ncbi:hypothetical protein CB1_001616101 [Camelus ferus]|nr:hypothetical protein CB1_001616101 [Camelus ferus]